MEKEKDGVWRTIRGRRIFIAKGESLGEAMSRSGKFSRVEKNEAKREARFDDRANKVLKEKPFSRKQVKEQQKYSSKYNVRDVNSYNKDSKNRINENAHIEGSGQTRVQRNWNKYSEEDRREHRHELIQKKLADYKAKKQSNNKIENVYEQDKKEGNIANRLKTIEEQERYDRLYDRYKEQGMSDEKINNLLGKRPKTGLENNNKVELSKKQIEAGNKLNANAEKGARSDINTWLDSDEKDYGSFIKDLADEWNIDKKRAEKMFYEELDKKQKYEDSFKPTKEDMGDINHWYNDDPREEWNKQETIKNYVEKKKSNNSQTTNRILERSGKVNQKTLKSYADDGLATDITRYSDKDIDKLEKKHGRLTHLKTSIGTYGMNGALLKSEKTGEYFVITARNGNLFRLV